jgi:hypothetical protein
MIRTPSDFFGDVAPATAESQDALERGERRRATRLLAEPDAGGPDERCVRDPVAVELLRRDVEVGCLRLATEEERETVGRMELAEDDGCPQHRIRAHPPRVDAEALQRPAHVRPKGIVADLGDDRRPMAETRYRDRDVGGLPPSDFAKVRTSASVTPICSG